MSDYDMKEQLNFNDMLAGEIEDLENELVEVKKQLKKTKLQLSKLQKQIEDAKVSKKTYAIYKNYESFTKRKDKKLNGFSITSIPIELLEQWSKTNTGCWNCEDCTNCIDCESCTNCNKCNGCRECSRCVDCANCYKCNMCTNCKDTNWSNLCSDCSNSYMCKRCENCKNCGKLENEQNKKNTGSKKPNILTKKDVVVIKKSQKEKMLKLYKKRKYTKRNTKGERK